MKKSVYFWMMCSVIPFVLLACPTPDTRAENAKNTLLAPIIEALTKHYNKTCPKGMNAFIRARIYNYASGFGHHETAKTLAELKIAVVERFNERYQINCEMFMERKPRPRSQLEQNEMLNGGSGGLHSSNEVRAN